jgi:transcriptional regulator with XRE-family HTH domain
MDGFDAGAGAAGREIVARQIGSRIRLRRTELGLTQQHLAQALGCTFQRVAHYESGRPIPADRLLALARALDTSIEFFFVDIPVEEPEPDRELRALARAFRRIADPEIRKATVAFVQALSDSPDDERTG